MAKTLKLGHFTVVWKTWQTHQDRSRSLKEWRPHMRKAIAIAVLTAGLAACGIVSTLVDGFKYPKAVVNDLEQETGGCKPG